MVGGEGKGEWLADNKTVYHVTSLQRVWRRYTKHEEHASQLRGDSCTRLESPLHFSVSSRRIPSSLLFTSDFPRLIIANSC